MNANKNWICNVMNGTTWYVHFSFSLYSHLENIGKTDSSAKKIISGISASATHSRRWTAVGRDGEQSKSFSNLQSHHCTMGKLQWEFGHRIISFLIKKFIWNIWTRIKWEGNLSEIFGRGFMGGKSIWNIWIQIKWEGNLSEILNADKMRGKVDQSELATFNGP